MNNKKIVNYKIFGNFIISSLNEGMTLSEFKKIFYMEYVHRMWGRSIGAVFFLPAVFFAYKGWVSKSLKPRLFIYGGLLAFQVTFFLLTSVVGYTIVGELMEDATNVCGSLDRSQPASSSVSSTIKSMSLHLLVRSMKKL